MACANNGHSLPTPDAPPRLAGGCQNYCDELWQSTLRHTKGGQNDISALLHSIFPRCNQQVLVRQVLGAMLIKCGQDGHALVKCGQDGHASITCINTHGPMPSDSLRTLYWYLVESGHESGSGLLKMEGRRMIVHHYLQQGCPLAHP